MSIAVLSPGPLKRRMRSWEVKEGTVTREERYRTSSPGSSILGTRVLSPTQARLVKQSVFCNSGLFFLETASISRVALNMLTTTPCFVEMDGGMHELGNITFAPGATEMQVDIALHASSPLMFSLKSHGRLRLRVDVTAPSVRISSLDAYEGPALADGRPLREVVSKLLIPVITMHGRREVVTVGRMMHLDALLTVLIRQLSTAFCDAPFAPTFTRALAANGVARAKVAEALDLPLPASITLLVDADVVTLVAEMRRRSAAPALSYRPFTCPLLGVDVDAEDAVVALPGGHVPCTSCAERCKRGTVDFVLRMSADALITMFKVDAALRWEGGRGEEMRVYGMLPLRSKLWRRLFFASPMGCLSGECSTRADAAPLEKVVSQLLHADLSEDSVNRMALEARVRRVRALASSLTLERGGEEESRWLEAIRRYLEACATIIQKTVLKGAHGTSCFSSSRFFVSQTIEEVALHAAEGGAMTSMRSFAPFQPEVVVHWMQHMPRPSPVDLRQVAANAVFWNDRVQREGVPPGPRQAAACQAAMRIFLLFRDACLPTCPCCDTPVVLEEGCTHALCDLCGCHFCMCCGKPFLSGSVPTSMHDLAEQIVRCGGSDQVSLAELAQNYAVHTPLKLVMRGLHRAVMHDVSAQDAACAMRKVRNMRLNMPSDVFMHGENGGCGSCVLDVATFRTSVEKNDERLPEPSLLKWHKPSALVTAVCKLWSAPVESNAAYLTVMRVAKMLSEFFEYAADVGQGEAARVGMLAVMNAVSQCGGEGGGVADGVGLLSLLSSADGGFEALLNAVSHFGSRRDVSERIVVVKGEDGRRTYLSMPDVETLTSSPSARSIAFIQNLGLTLD